MQIHIKLADSPVELARLQAALVAIDPAAVIDRDPLSAQLRVSAGLSAGELQAVARAAGLELVDAQIERRPSECCGGCGG